MAVKRVVLQHFSMRYDYMKERPNIYQPSQAYIDAYSDENYNPKPPAHYTRSRSQRNPAASLSSYGGRMSSMHGQRPANSRQSSRNGASRNASAIYPSSGGFKTLNVHEEDDDDEALEAFGRIDDEDDEWARSTKHYQQQRELQKQREAMEEDRYRRESVSEGEVDEMDEDGESEDYQHYKHYWRELDEDEGDDYLYEQQQRVDYIAEEDEGENEVGDQEEEMGKPDNLRELKAQVEEVNNGLYGKEQLIMDNMGEEKLTTMRKDAQEEEEKETTPEKERKRQEEEEQDNVDGAKSQGPSSDISATTITENNQQQTPVTKTTTHINNWQPGDENDNDDDVKLLDSISDLNEKLPEIYETAKIVVNSAAVPEAEADADAEKIKPVTATATEEPRPPTDKLEDDSNGIRSNATTAAEDTTMRMTFGKTATAVADTIQAKPARNVYFALDAYQNDEDADIDEDDDYDEEEVEQRKQPGPSIANAYTRKQRQQHHQRYIVPAQGPRQHHQQQPENWRYRTHHSQVCPPT